MRRCYSHTDRLNRNLNIATINLSRCEFNCFIKCTDLFSDGRGWARTRRHWKLVKYKPHEKDLKFKSTSIKHVRVFRTSCFALLFGNFMVQETWETRRCERLKSDDISPPFDICLTMLPIKIDVACDKNICRLRGGLSMCGYIKGIRSVFVWIQIAVRLSIHIENSPSLMTKCRIFFIYLVKYKIFV